MPKRVALNQASHITGRGQEAILRPAAEFDEEVRQLEQLEQLEQSEEVQHGANAHLRKSTNAQTVSRSSGVTRPDRSVFSKLSCRLPSQVLDGIDDFRRLLRDYAGGSTSREEVVEAILKLAMDNQENKAYLERLSKEVGRIKGAERSRRSGLVRPK